MAFYKIMKNGSIPINRRTFFQGKDSVELNHFQFFKINSSMAETIKKKFLKQNFHKQIAEFDNN